MLKGVAPNNNNPPPKAAVANNYNCYTFYNDQSNLYQQTSTTSSSRNNTGHSNQNQYYHWQGSDSGKSPNCESQASNSPAQNQNSLNQQHNRLLNISSAHQHQHQQQISGQIKSSLIKLNSKKSRKSSNLHGLFSPTSSTQSYGINSLNKITQRIKCSTIKNSLNQFKLILSQKQFFLLFVFLCSALLYLIILYKN